MNIINHPKGFTLTELIIYVALVGILLTAGAIFARDVLLGSIKAQVKARVQSEGRFALERMRQEIAQAKDVEKFIFAAGGRQATPAIEGLTTAETYDVSTNTWTSTASMQTGRRNHAAAVLPDGNILIIGGRASSSAPFNSTEIYNPEKNIWTSGPSMYSPRRELTATVLNDGRVLVVGGFRGDPPDENYEIYDPVTGTWSHALYPLTDGGWGHTATLLKDGRVLVAGGKNDVSYNNTYVYTPNSGLGSWVSAGNLTTARQYHTATLLLDGRVLVVGGKSNSDGTTLASAEIYNPSTNSWTTTSSLTTSRRGHVATLLSDGKVLITGGVQNTVPPGNSGTDVTIASTEIYDPVSGIWTSGTSLPMALDFQTGQDLGGQFYATGGGSSSQSPWIFPNVYQYTNAAWTTLTSMNGARQYHTATPLRLCRFILSDGITRLSIAVDGDGGSSKRLQICKKSGSDCSSTDNWTNLTSSDVEVSASTCANMSTGTSLGEEVVKASLMLKAKNPSGKQEFSAEQKFETSISLRL